jgi:hypothetical protein
MTEPIRLDPSRTMLGVPLLREGNPIRRGLAGRFFFMPPQGLLLPRLRPLPQRQPPAVIVALVAPIDH